MRQVKKQYIIYILIRIFYQPVTNMSDYTSRITQKQASHHMKHFATTITTTARDSTKMNSQQQVEKQKKYQWKQQKQKQ
jgi:hypothetical protein